MLCEKCRIREANVRFMEIINGVKNEHNLCAQCAAEMNFGPYTTLLEGEFNLGKLLSGLMGLPAAAEADKSLTEVVCPTCGTTYQEFVDHSRFGCADCYHADRREDQKAAGQRQPHGKAAQDASGGRLRAGGYG